MTTKVTELVRVQDHNLSYVISSACATEVDQVQATVLFLPYWGGTSRTFDLVAAQAFASRTDIKCVAITYPGTGDAPIPADDSPAIHSVQARADQLHEIMVNSLQLAVTPNSKLIICAHSMSAKITYALLQRLAREEVSANYQVVGLLLLAPAPLKALVLPEAMRDQQFSAYNDRESAEWTVSNILTTGNLPYDVLKSTTDDCVSMSPGARQGWIQYGMQDDCTDAVTSIKASLPNLKIDIIVGDKDMVETVDRVRLETYLPLENYGFNVCFKIVKDCGHLLPLEAAAQVVEALQTLLDVATDL